MESSCVPQEGKVEEAAVGDKASVPTHPHTPTLNHAHMGAHELPFRQSVGKRKDE